MKIAVLADTHIPKRAKRLPNTAFPLLEKADAIIHAGDVVSEEFLNSLRELAPVYAVLGNNDLTLSLPERLELTFENVAIAVMHDTGASQGRARRMRKSFPSADILIFGHSHMPMNVVEEDLLLFNPGSPTDRRQQPNYTMGMLTIEDGQARAEIIVLG